MRRLRRLAVAAALAATIAACSGTEPCPEPVSHRHCCTDCASAVCVSCCAFYGGCCGG